MNDGSRTSHRRAWPWWVRLAFWGVATSTQAWMYLWISVGVTAFCFFGGLTYDRWLLLAVPLFALAAVWYYRALRWVQRSGNSFHA